MEDKLVTLAILTYTKAQILKNVLENEGIETYIHNVNQIQPVVSSGVRLRIKESDLPRALKITESSTWLSESIVGEKEPKTENKSNKILIPVDFSNYSMKACEFAFNLAKTENAEVSTPVNAPVVTSVRVETYGIDYGLPETLTPFDISSWYYSQYHNSNN